MKEIKFVVPDEAWLGHGRMLRNVLSLMHADKGLLVTDMPDQPAIDMSLYAPSTIALYHQSEKARAAYDNADVVDIPNGMKAVEGLVYQYRNIDNYLLHYRMADIDAALAVSLRTYFGSRVLGASKHTALWPIPQQPAPIIPAVNISQIEHTWHLLNPLNTESRALIYRDCQWLDPEAIDRIIQSDCEVSVHPYRSGKDELDPTRGELYVTMPLKGLQWGSVSQGVYKDDLAAVAAMTTIIRSACSNPLVLEDEAPPHVGDDQHEGLLFAWQYICEASAPDDLD